MKAIIAVYVVLGIMGLVGEVLCFWKFVECDFEKPYKAEIIYGVSAFTGVGSVVGWFSIDDTRQD